jgi:hypothetical protein
MSRILVPLAVAGVVAACGTELTSGTLVAHEGGFTFQVPQITDSAFRGKATFSIVRTATTSSLTVTFTSFDRRFIMELNAPGGLAAIEGRSIGLESEMTGTITLPSSNETFEITTGTVSWDVDPTGITNGEIIFVAIQGPDGPRPGAAMNGYGTFTANCLGECRGFSSPG